MTSLDDGFEVVHTDPDLAEAERLDNTELRLAIKQLAKARVKLDKLNPGYVQRKLVDELNRQTIVLATVTVPRGGCVYRDEGIAPTIAAMTPVIRSREGLLVLCFHTIMIQEGFVCQCPNGALPVNWSDTAGANFRFTYSHAKISGTRIVLKICLVKGSLQFLATVQGNSQAYTYEAQVDNFVVPSTIGPKPLAKANSGIKGTLEFATLLSSMLFDLDSLRVQLNAHIIDPLLGKTPTALKVDEAGEQTKSVPALNVQHQSVRSVERCHRTQQHLFVSVGHDDLGPSIPPAPGHHPAFPGGGISGGGGSLVGPGHPIFGYEGSRMDYIPPNVPPGARFDPFGPGVPQPFGGGGRRGPSGGLGLGLPNPDHMKMPTEEDDFY